MGVQKRPKYYDITNEQSLREGFKKKKNVKFGLLAEIRRGRGLRGVHEPNLLSGIFHCLKMI